MCELYIPLTVYTQDDEEVVNYYNQAHTCKTLGVVTKPMSIASTHAQMHPRNIIHARAILISYSRPRPAPKDAGRGREYEI